MDTTSLFLTINISKTGHSNSFKRSSTHMVSLGGEFREQGTSPFGHYSLKGSTLFVSIKVYPPRLAQIIRLDMTVILMGGMGSTTFPSQSSSSSMALMLIMP